MWNAGGCDSRYLREGAGSDGRRCTSNRPGHMLGYRLQMRRLDRDDHHVVAR